jgi:hypothetical protein
MSMMDFASALGGAGGGGAPPDLAGGGGAPPPDLGAPPPGQGAAPDDTAQGEETYGSSLEALQVAEHALHAFIKMDPDHGDRAIGAQCLQNVLKLQAANQDSSKSGDLSSLQRALGQGPGGTAGPVGQAAAAAGPPGGPPPGPPGGGY